MTSDPVARRFDRGRLSARPSRARFCRLAIALCTVVVLTGCHSEADEAHRTEAGRITHAVDSLRKAENDRKSPYLSVLERMPCSVPDVCRLKRACVDAYQRQLHALGMIGAARRLISGDGGAAPAASAAADLSKAQKELVDARNRAQHCADLEGAVSRHYKL